MTERVDLVITGASELVTAPPAKGPLTRGDLNRLHVMAAAGVAVHRGRIVEVGSSTDIETRYTASIELDASGGLISAGLVEPHTHLVFGGSRHQEYERILTGSDSASNRLEGGINFTVDQTRSATDAELKLSALRDLDAFLSSGVTTLEAKSGYGLTPDHELRLLRIINELDHPVDVIPTYLAAHVVPTGGDRAAYVSQVIDTLHQARPLAEYCDVFCDPAGFSIEECRAIAERAIAAGFKMRIHADQTGSVGAAELAAELRASSADHLDHVSSAGMAALADSKTVAVVLPTVALHMLEVTPGYDGKTVRPPPKARLVGTVHAMADAGVPLALSTDYNPGTSPTTSMPLAMQLAARLFRLSYAAIWNMSTINAAHALDRGADRGSLEAGKRADVVLWDVPEHGMVINRLGAIDVRAVIKDGKPVTGVG